MSFLWLKGLVLKDTHRGNTPSYKTCALMKSINKDICVVVTLNKLFVRDFYAQIKFSKINK